MIKVHRYLPFTLAILSTLAACNVSVEGGASDCPSPSPGMCTPEPDCVNGVRRDGSASCVDGQWVCGEVACVNDGGACAEGTIEASSYDRTCAADSDCIIVYQGSLCSECLCGNAAISQSAQSAYESDFAARPQNANVCNCPDEALPVCTSGVCTEP